MPPRVHVGVLPNRPVAAIADIAELAEDLGFAGIWVADSQSIFRDALAALTLSATPAWLASSAPRSCSAA